MAEEGVPMTSENEIATTKTVDIPHDTLDNLLLQTVHEHPFSVSGGALIIGVTLLKIIKKLKGK
jgi:hypothetical protein